MIICEYCETRNPKERGTCLACGAPIEKRQPITKVKPVKTAAEKPKPAKSPENEIRKVGEKADEAYFTVMNTYAIAWRTVGEAIAIAVAAFIIGVTGGVVRMGFVGILGAIAVGVAVGMTHKNFYFVIASAPGGALIGLAASAVFWIAGQPRMGIILVTIGAIVGAIWGGRRRHPFSQRNWWEKLRPVLGALGGLGFGILGLLLGLGIAGIANLIQ
jgi:hypothetical protein